VQKENPAALAELLSQKRIARNGAGQSGDTRGVANPKSRRE
jgi:hypothetical protein